MIIFSAERRWERKNSSERLVLEVSSEMGWIRSAR